MHLRDGIGRRLDDTLFTRLDRARLERDDFSIVADDCWGGAVYQRLGLPYRSPFAGLSIEAPDFITLLRDLDANLHGPLTFRRTSKWGGDERAYPIGVTEHDVEIHFIHYPTEREAEEKWRRRGERIDAKNLFVKFDAGKPFATEAERAAFAELPFERKVMLTPPGDREGVAVPGWVYDGFQQLHRSLEVFDVVAWLNGGDGRPARPGLRRAARVLARH